MLGVVVARVCTISFALVVLMLGSVAGCGWSLFGLHHPPAGAVLALEENPLFTPVADREFVWHQVVDTIDNHFQIAREEPVRLIGGVLSEGRLETVPLVGSTYLEPWHTDSTPGFERLHATLQSVRRQATVRVIPTEGGFLIEVTVIKELEDVDRPERATVGGATLRHDGSLVRREGGIEGGPVTLGWIPLGRDQALEQRILLELRGRISEINPLELGPLPAAAEAIPPAG